MSNTSSENNTSCANCGKGEEDGINLKSCNACMMVKYCSRDCQTAHRPQHKKECKKKAKELHEIELFKQPPPEEDCPICFLMLPGLGEERIMKRTYMACCGKTICNGCIYTVQSRAYEAGRSEEDDICPFCRTPPPSSHAELIKRYKERVELNDKNALYCLGCLYSKGKYGLPQDLVKALELWHRAAKLGSAQAYHNIGYAYRNGRGVEFDMKKALHYTELAAIGGNVESRYNLGCFMGQACNLDRAVKHWMIAVHDGDHMALEGIKKLYRVGRATKDDYTEALRSYQSYQDQIKSDQRDEAAASGVEINIS